LLLPRYALSSVSVIGHTDTVGTEAYNRQLGKNRAEPSQSD
ncbi:MAG: hypothetical protein JWM45_424, partial [Pseudonocardiales bacterium]|nr:hypothetical protein [Pseudonocardiales bacterium]